MRITVHLNRYYDWDPVPDGVQVTEADLASKRAKPANGGGYLMRVAKDAPVGATHTTVMLPEHELCAMIIADAIRDHRTDHTRSSAVANYLARHTMPHHAHRSWIEAIEVEDDAPDEALIRKMLKPHVDAGHIEVDDIEAILKSYLTPLDNDGHADHLHAHFGVKKGTP